MDVVADSFFEHLDGFFNYRQQIYDLSPQTLKSNRVDLNLFKDFMTNYPATSINGAAVMDFQFHLKQERNNCGASINRKIITLKSYATYLTQIEAPFADQLPFKRVLKIRNGYRKRPDALTIRQIQLLFAAFDPQSVLGVRDYAAYALMYQLGLRVGEVHALDLKDLDFEKAQIHVTGKGRKPRTLPMNTELIEIISHYLAMRPLLYDSHLSPALFVSKKGNRLAIRTMEENLQKLLPYCHLNATFKVTCHTLRHSMASHLNDNGTDILVIQSILGHSSTRSTEPYIHPSAQVVARSLEKLPIVRLVKELIRNGELDLSVQKRNRPKRE